MTAFVLKLIAIFSMVIDHIGSGFLNNNLLMRSIGRLAFILYAFLIAESYFHLREKPERLKVHLIKMFILCAISETPFNLFDHRSWSYIAVQNALCTLTLGFTALIISGWWKKKYKEKKLLIISGIVVIWFLSAATSYFIRSEYTFAGVLLICFFYLYLQKADELDLCKRVSILLLLLAGYWFLYAWASAGFRGGTWLSYKWNTLLRYLPGTLAATIPIALYNRKLGYHSRWFQIIYSCFYPLQFIVLIIVRTVMRQ